MTKLEKKLIIFDMDGTLIDSGDAISNTINFVRTNIGLSTMPKEQLLKNINNPDINSAEFFYGTSAFTPEQTELFGQYYDKHCVSDIKIYQGIKQLVKDLSKEYILCVATNASKEFAMKMLKSVDILDYFEIVIGANCVEKPKPASDMLLKICFDLNIKPTNSILIGDSLKDYRAALGCDMDCILVDWGFSSFDLEQKDLVKSVDLLRNNLL